MQHDWLQYSLLRKFKNNTLIKIPKVEMIYDDLALLQHFLKTFLKF